MSIRIDKPWVPVAELDSVLAQLGVFALADADGATIFIGYAGGRSLFGLKGEIAASAKLHEATSYRCEVTTAYRTRHLELLMLHVHDFGDLPPCNSEDRSQLGRLSPA